MMQEEIFDGRLVKISILVVIVRKDDDNAVPGKKSHSKAVKTPQANWHKH